MQVINLYDRYDGYQEIVLTEEDNLGQQFFKVQLLAYLFDTILSFIPLEIYDQTSVMYNYLKSEGWNDENWQCVRLQEFYDQLLVMDGNIPIQNVAAFDAIKSICNSALINKNRLFIELS